MIRVNKEEALEQLEAEQRRLDLSATCMMCELAEGEDAAPIAESEHGVVVLDGFAATEGHLLVISRRHVERMSELEWPVYADRQRLGWEATRTIEEVLKPARIYTAALGASAKIPTSFPHFHFHVVPIYETDERARPAHVFSWSSGVIRYGPEEARRLSNRLRAGWGGKRDRSRQLKSA
jgi:diadenosine tetraphosphate (Ap4A) HIT family hydrolase